MVQHDCHPWSSWNIQLPQQQFHRRYLGRAQILVKSYLSFCTFLIFRLYLLRYLRDCLGSCSCKCLRKAIKATGCGTASKKVRETFSPKQSYHVSIHLFQEPQTRHASMTRTNSNVERTMIETATWRQVKRFFPRAMHLLIRRSSLYHGGGESSALLAVI